MNNKKLNELRRLAGIESVPLNENDDLDNEDDRIAAEEDKMMKELHPLKKQLDAIMKRYPHASYDDVTHWLKG